MEELESKPISERFAGFKYGIITAIIASLWLVYLFVTKSVISPIQRMTLLIVPILLFIGCYVSIKNSRSSNSGFLSFSQGFKAGLQSAVAYALVIGITTFICQSIIYPEFAIDVIDNAKTVAIKEHVDAAEMNKILGYLKEDIQVTTQVTKTIAGSLFTGAICSALMAALMRK